MSILKKLERLTGRNDWEETNGPQPVLDDEAWFVNGNFETACVEEEERRITIRDSQDAILYRGNF